MRRKRSQLPCGKQLLTPFPLSIHRAKARQGLAERGWNGAFLGGNYAAGVALGRCVEAAYEQAGEIGTWLATHPAPTPAR